MVYTPPDVRLNTDVVIGSHTDEEAKNNGANNFGLETQSQRKNLP